VEVPAVVGTCFGSQGVVCELVPSACGNISVCYSPEELSVWDCNTCMTSCMFPRVRECSIKCTAYLEVWLLYIKECLSSLNLVLKSWPV
jgi:hypothetical protein